MIIISDTSPISNLLLIGQLSLLKVLYGQLIIPDAVFQEIKALETFAIDVSGVQTADWIEVRAVCDQMLVEKLVTEVDRGAKQKRSP